MSFSDDHNGVIPDLVFATHERITQSLQPGRFWAAPEIVIEILSPGRTNTWRDRHIKRNLYAARGVAEYWIVDPETRSIELHRKGLPETTLYRSDDLTTTVRPGFSVSVDALFA